MGARLAVSDLAVIIASNTFSIGVTHVNRGILLDDGTEASSNRSTEYVIGLNATTHTGILFHLAYHTAHIGSLDIIVGRIAVTHPSRHPLFAIVHELTCKDATACIFISVVNLYFLSTQIMDRTRHLSEDADGCADIGYLGVVDAVATSIVVALKGVLMANGRPFTAPFILAQHILHMDIALLPEIDIPRVAAFVHIVGKIYQIAFFDDERIALCSIAFGENSLIVVPLTIDIFSSFIDGVFIADHFRLATAVPFCFPLRHIFVPFGNP